MPSQMYRPRLDALTMNCYRSNLMAARIHQVMSNLNGNDDNKSSSNDDDDDDDGNGDDDDDTFTSLVSGS